MRALLGIIAYSIRNDWSYGVESRVDTMRWICMELNETALYESLGNDIDDITYDGRWMRDCWTGPYGGYYWTDIEDIVDKYELTNVTHSDSLFCDYDLYKEEIDQRFGYN